MARIRIELSMALHKLFFTAPRSTEIHRAWVDGSDLVLDLRGPDVPDVEEVVTAEVESREVITMIGSKTVFVRRSVG